MFGPLLSFYAYDVTCESRNQEQQQQEAIARAAALDAHQQAIAQSQTAQQSQQLQVFGQGYGACVPLQHLPQHLQGKPAFFDATRGTFFDGQQAYYYVPVNNDATFTAIELGHSGHHSQQKQQHQQQAERSGQGAHDGGRVVFGQSYGERVLLPSELAPHLRGKPAFFDATRGIPFDGQNAYVYKREVQPRTAAEQLSQHSEAGSNLQEKAYYQKLVYGMNTKRSLYLFAL